MEPISRRQFNAALASAACACLMCPNQLALAAENAKPVQVGSIKDFAHEGAYDQWAKSGRFFVVRQGGKLYASSSICTHKSTVPLASKPADHQFYCSRHGSRFDLSGRVIKGPAKQCLPRYGISVGADGVVSVDPAKRFDEAQWGEAGSFVRVD